MGNFIYNLLQIIQSEWFPYFAIIWLSLIVIYEALLNKWQFFATLASLIRQPIIFANCNEAERASGSKENNVEVANAKEIPFYPRLFLEQIACSLKSFFTFPIKHWIFPPVTKAADGVYPF